MDKTIPEAVAWPFSILEAGNWREVYMGTKHMRLEVSYPYEAWERLMAALAAAQQQGGGDLDEVVCLSCGDPIMPMGQLCHACSHPVSAPPSAPVGVELFALRVQEWLHREHDILCPVQEIEQAMRTPCSCPFTERTLAQQPAAVDEFAADRERLLRAFMMECGIIGAKEAGVNLARGIKAALAAQHQEPKS